MRRGEARTAFSKAALTGECANGHWQSTPRGHVHIRCGRCLRCQKRRSSALVGRMLGELEVNPGVFITGTLNDDALGSRDWLRPDVCQVETKRLRERWKYHGFNANLIVWERGEATGRPHFHAALYGPAVLDLPSKDKGSNLHVPWWRFGLVNVKALTAQAARYMTGYMFAAEKQSLGIFHSRSHRLGDDYIQRYCIDMVSGRAAVGAKYSRWPDPETGLLDSATVEIGFKLYNVDRSWLEFLRAAGLLRDQTELSVDLDYYRSHTELWEAGRDVYGETSRREAEFRVALRRKREADAAAKKTQLLEVNGRIHKLGGRS